MGLEIVVISQTEIKENVFIAIYWQWNGHIMRGTVEKVEKKKQKKQEPLTSVSHPF